MMKGCKSIAEYAIRRWLERENFVLSCFELKVSANEGILKDLSGDTLRLVYDGAAKTVYLAE